MSSILKRLKSLRDKEYKDFHSALMPTVNPDRILGVRVPMIRKLGKEISADERMAFMKNLPHQYYEENNLHTIFISQIRDFDRCIKEIDLFLPYVDNWATCDMIRPKVLLKYPEKFLEKIKEWISSEHVYTVRFAVEMLMCYFLDDLFCEEYLRWVSDVKSDEYYIKMTQAWFFATALAKKWDSTICFLEKRKLSPWVHNKTIQKARESFRITKEQKVYLNTLKQKML